MAGGKDGGMRRRRRRRTRRTRRSRGQTGGNGIASNVHSKKRKSAKNLRVRVKRRAWLQAGRKPHYTLPAVVSLVRATCESVTAADVEALPRVIHGHARFGTSLGSLELVRLKRGSACDVTPRGVLQFFFPPSSLSRRSTRSLRVERRGQTPERPRQHPQPVRAAAAMQALRPPQRPRVGRAPQLRQLRPTVARDPRRPAPQVLRRPPT